MRNFFIVGLIDVRCCRNIPDSIFLMNCCMEDKISRLTSSVFGQYKLNRAENGFTVAISGIDATGKC